MRRPAIVAVAVGSVLVTAAGVAVAATVDGQPRPAPAGWQQLHGPMGPGMQAPGSMHAMSVRSEFDYLARMVPHHEEAVAAAKQLQRSGRPELRRLGTAIVTTQTAEIARLKAWLARWYPQRSPTVDYRPMMRDLSQLSGAALDLAFLRDMIPHHMDAVMMSQRLLVRDLARHAEVAAFARTVRDEQHAEIFLMQELLADSSGNGSRMGSRMGMPHGSGGMHGWSG